METPEQYLVFLTLSWHKPDIANLLKTELDMPRDSQALYEFMQNAVDAGTTGFILFHYHDLSQKAEKLTTGNK